MTTTRELSWRDLVIRANPDHNRESTYMTEYEFTAPQARALPPELYEDGKRVFKGHYQRRGAYAPETVAGNDLTWGGQQLIWNGSVMTWGDE